MEKNEFLLELLHELSYRSDEGYPILSKSTHISIMSEILDEWGYTDIKDELIKNLMEAGEEKKYSSPALNKVVKYKDRDGNDKEGLVGSLLRLAKDQPGREAAERALPAEGTPEREKINNELGGEGQPNRNIEKEKSDKADVEAGAGEAPATEEPPQPGVFAGQGGDSYRAGLSKDDPAYKPSEKDIENAKSKVSISDDNKKIVDDFNSRIDKSTMNDTAKSEAKSIVDKLSIIFDDSKSKDEVAETLSSLNISVSSNKKKLYLDDMRKHGGGLYKILGDGTKSTVSTINKIAQYIELPEDDNKMAIEIEAAAKPDLGSKNIRSVYKKNAKGFTDEINDPNVEKLFQTPPLDRIETNKFKSLFGPTDDNGNLLSPSSQHSKEYLKFSIENNVSIDNTIKVLDKYAAEGKISEKLSTSVKSHKERMDDILNRMEIPSEAASKAVDESYARMFDELMNENQDMASRMLKQFAEMRLYDSEIAKGDEAYLPGDGSFPAGDKLVFKNGAGGTERVSFVSVKYGKNGDVYGCPANSKALQSLHPDKSKRERQGQYIGEGGYTLSVNDNMVSDLDTTKKSIKSLIGEMPDIQSIFDNDEIENIADIVYTTKERVEELKARYETNGKIDKVGWEKLQKDILKDPTMVELNTKLKEVVSVDKFSKIIGSRNGRVADKYDFGAAHFMTGLTLANQIVTSAGYDGVTHNKQYYNNGTLKSSTVAGTIDRDEWYINFRMYKTAGRGGGGAQVSYIGAELKGKYGDSQIGELK